jgi:predicted acetyltransferase
LGIIIKKIETVNKEDKELLYNYLQKYLCEMSKYYDYDMDENGNYVYKYFPLYFSGSNDRQAYFIYFNNVCIGFALINAYSFTGEPVDNAIAEFTIFSCYRNKGYGIKAVEALIKKRGGSWQFKYSNNNSAAVRFWQKVKEKYCGVETVLVDNETAVTINPRFVSI